MNTDEGALMYKPGKRGPFPSRHTVVISDVPSMYWKLVWDIDQFGEIQRYDSELMEPLAFSAINVCISASSLRDWVVTAYVARQRSEDRKAQRDQVIEHIYRHISQQKMCEAIANTAKHSRFNEGQWTGGSVRIDFDEPTEDAPGGFILRHVHEDGVFSSIALNAFDSLRRNWWGELQNLGFAFPNTAPAWQQVRLQRLFGPR